MNETVLMIMLVAIVVFFFVFGMIGLERSKRNGSQCGNDSDVILDELKDSKE